GRFKPREDVPCHGNGEARVDDPLILLHRPDPTLRWRFWARKRRSLPTSVESRVTRASGAWRGIAHGCPGAVYVALGLPQDCGILFLGVETLRFIVVPLVVLALSLPVQALIRYFLSRTHCTRPITAKHTISLSEAYGGPAGLLIL